MPGGSSGTGRCNTALFLYLIVIAGSQQDILYPPSKCGIHHMAVAVNSGLLKIRLRTPAPSVPQHSAPQSRTKDQGMDPHSQWEKQQSHIVEGSVEMNHCNHVYKHSATVSADISLKVCGAMHPFLRVSLPVSGIGLSSKS